MTINCLFCNQPLTQDAQILTTWIYLDSCKECGLYYKDQRADVTTKINADDKVRIASYLQTKKLNNSQIRPVITDFKNKSGTIEELEDNGINPNKITLITIEEMIDQFPKRIDEKLNKALQNLGKLSHYLGEPITVGLNYQPILYALNSGEFEAILFALRDDGYIKCTWDGIAGTNLIVITPKGYERIYELGKVNPTSHQAFVAMWFPDPVKNETEHNFLDNVYKEGFAKAIDNAGYKPQLIKNKEFLGEIHDEIIAEIKRSRFLVADFTGQRGGVYYEAGFAHGLNIPVIYTCHCDYMKDCHFDTNHYNHIVWKDEADLYTQLLNRIRATIGQGPKTN
ncbi:MAG: hypothetical protein WC980_01330 [Candidatus Brocadiia bacterium]